MAELESIVDQLSKLTVIEAAELVKKLETAWGVTAAAPIAVATAGGSAAGGAAAPQGIRPEPLTSGLVPYNQLNGPFPESISRRFALPIRDGISQTQSNAVRPACPHEASTGLV